MTVRTAGRVALAVVIPVAALAVGGVSPAMATAINDTCHPSDVSVTLGRVEGGAGGRYASLTIAAHEGVSCQLSGYASGFAFRAADGSALPTNPRQAAGNQPEVIVTPSTPARIDLHWVGIDATGDDAGMTPAALDVALPGTTGTSTVSWTGGPVFQHGWLEDKPVWPEAAG